MIVGLGCYKYVHSGAKETVFHLFLHLHCLCFHSIAHILPIPCCMSFLIVSHLHHYQQFYAVAGLIRLSSPFAIAISLRLTALSTFGSPVLPLNWTV